jgi:alpha-L-rhamnosidase
MATMGIKRISLVKLVSFLFLMSTSCVSLPDPIETSNVTTEANLPQMYYADRTVGYPWSKDPDVVRWNGKYYMYCTIKSTSGGLGIGIAESTDMICWTQVAVIPRGTAYEANGQAAPCVVILNGRLHMFYQTYGNGASDAICHAWSDDGIHFTKNPDNPIFHPRPAPWTVGRAIDADVIEHGGTVYLYYATRDPSFTVQKIGVAIADLNSDFSKSAWTEACSDSILQPRLPWEKKCIEAPSVFYKFGRFYMFYAGAYNNEPQQIGVAVSNDGITWQRLSQQPILPVGQPGEWNSSESGHPGVFVDDDGQIYLFFQGNNDNGATWYLSKMKVEWEGQLPYLVNSGDNHQHHLVDPIDEIITLKGNGSFQIGKRDENILQQRMIWTGEKDLGTNHFRAFRKTFTLNGMPEKAILNIFADNRYLLWVNSSYIQRGPVRFNPKGPTYDSIDIRSYLKKGKNVIAIQVMAFRSGISGQRIRHLPGLTVELIADDERRLTTDESWRWSSQTQYSVAEIKWGFIRYNNDGRNEPLRWASVDYDDSEWQHAVLIDGMRWGPIRASFIPPLPEVTAVVNPPTILPKGLTYPIMLTKGESVVVDLGRMVLGYEVMDLDAAAGTVLNIEHGQRFNTDMYETYGSVNTYIARDGRQIFMAADSYGHHYLKLTAKAGPVTLHELQVVERRYPYKNAASFQSNDAFLNELWSRAVHTLQMNCEDGYLDCPLRERSEWMGDAAVVEYPGSRVVFGISDARGIPISDAGLIKQIIRNTALSRLKDGRLMAHVPSDRWDIHGYIEDYSCLWVQMVREMYDHTEDVVLVNEIWPALVGQMQWFLDRRTSRGLVNAREFVIFDNPQKYNVCEGATLNAFVYKALKDSAYLAAVIGQTQKQSEFTIAADTLYSDFNRELWDESTGNYYAGLDNPDDIPSAFPSKLNPSTHSALLSLHAGIVPPNRLERVRNYLFSTWSTGVGMPYTHAWLLEEFSRADSPQRDTEALNSIRLQWADVMTRTDTGTLTEGYNSGEASHNFGSSPLYYLATHVLGVRMDGLVREKRILVEPRPGDLTSVVGTVVTEHGPVPVSWIFSGSQWDFSFTVPEGITATVRLPVGTIYKKAVMDSKTLESGVNGIEHSGRWLEFKTGSGRHTGHWSVPIENHFSKPVKRNPVLPIKANLAK